MGSEELDLSGSSTILYAKVFEQGLLEISWDDIVHTQAFLNLRHSHSTEGMDP